MFKLRVCSLRSQLLESLAPRIPLSGLWAPLEAREAYSLRLGLACGSRGSLRSLARLACGRFRLARALKQAEASTMACPTSITGFESLLRVGISLVGLI